MRKISVELNKSKRFRADNHGVRLTSLSYHFPFQRVVSCRHQNNESSRRRACLLDPAIEACFRIIGMDGLALELELKLRQAFLPVVNGGLIILVVQMKKAASGIPQSFPILLSDLENSLHPGWMSCGLALGSRICSLRG